MFAAVIAGFVYGILGSMHCIGMCGPLILTIPFQSLQSKTKKAFAYILYGGGKTLSYMMLGLLFGIIGSEAQQLDMQRYVSIIAGLLLLLTAIIPIISRSANYKPAIVTQFNQWVTQKIARQFKNQRLYSYGFIGFLNGLLPCGFIYGAVAIAVSMGNTFHSVAFMLFFGVATMLSLTVFSLVFQILPMKARMNLRKLFPYLIIITAILLILRGLQIGIPVISPIFNGAEASCGHSCCS